jgi:hypothetical protein
MQELIRPQQQRIMRAGGLTLDRLPQMLGKFVLQPKPIPQDSQHQLARQPPVAGVQPSLRGLFLDVIRDARALRVPSQRQRTESQ